MPALTFTDAGGDVLNLNNGSNIKLLDLRGAGIPSLRHQTVQTPARDGETYIRTTVEPRFLIVELRIKGTNFADLQTQRRALITAFNPKVGVGTLKWTPDATVYAIDCLIEQGVGFANYRGTFFEDALVSFRCPDPMWRGATLNEETVTNSGSGLSFPISFPISFIDGLGTTIINNIGDVPSFPVITIPGACTNPIITNVTTGEKLSFPALTLSAGESLIIDCDARTAKVGTVSKIALLSADSEFWTLASGNNTITFATASGTAIASVDYYTRLLGL